MKKAERINLGLAISGALLRPGQRRTLQEIAAFCDCHKNNIIRIEQDALKKLRHPAKLRRLGHTTEDIRQT